MLTTKYKDLPETQKRELVELETFIASQESIAPQQLDMAPEIQKVTQKLNELALYLEKDKAQLSELKRETSLELAFAEAGGSSLDRQPQTHSDYFTLVASRLQKRAADYEHILTEIEEFLRTRQSVEESFIVDALHEQKNKLVLVAQDVASLKHAIDRVESAK